MNIRRPASGMNNNTGMHNNIGTPNTLVTFSILGIQNTLAILIVAAMILFPHITPQAANSKDIAALVNQYQRETKCGNVSVIIYDHGNTAYYGDADGLYQIGSMTKAFTGMAVQRLINEGLVDEDAVISEYIPGFEAYYDSAKVDITVRDLLEQKSGYTNNEKDYPGATKDETLSVWAGRISGLELKNMPGTEYAYSNVNYNLLGLITENVSGMSYREYMEQKILLPLGLKNTTVGTPSGGRIVEGTRLGYRRVFEFPVSVKEASIPAGYFYSNAEDMGRWIEIWATGNDVPADLKETIANVKENLKDEGDYYSGFELFPDGVTGHSGGTPNYSSRIVFDEKRQTGVCVLAGLNVAATTDSLCNSILDITCGKTGAGLTTDIWTIFDRVFTGVTAAGIFIFLLILLIRKRPALIVLDVVLVSLLTTVLILFPMIFGAGMKEIVFTWAPWSLAGGLGVITAAIIAATLKILTGNKDAAHNKTGKG